MWHFKIRKKNREFKDIKMHTVRIHNLFYVLGVIDDGPMRRCR